MLKHSNNNHWQKLCSFKDPFLLRDTNIQEQLRQNSGKHQSNAESRKGNLKTKKPFWCFICSCIPFPSSVVVLKIENSLPFQSGTFVPGPQSSKDLNFKKKKRFLLTHLRQLEGKARHLPLFHLRTQVGKVAGISSQYCKAKNNLGQKITVEVNKGVSKAREEKNGRGSLKGNQAFKSRIFWGIDKATQFQARMRAQRRPVKAEADLNWPRAKH